MPVALASLMVVVAAYCAIRPLAARYWRRSTEHDVDLAHVLMGLAMAAMLIGRLAAAWYGSLAVLFAAGTAWFGARALLARRPAPRPPSGGPARARVPRGSPGHHLAHMLASGSMLFMLLIGSSAQAAAAAVAPVSLALTLALASSVVLAAGRLVPAPAAGTPAGLAGGGVYGTTTSRPMLCPRLSGACQIAMGAVMIWMLLPMV